MTIHNDKEFKAALANLPRGGQRQVGARFVENVLALTPDAKVKNAITTAKRMDLIEDELIAAQNMAKKASVESYTQCGTECDWHTQAGHFVAEATYACLKSAGPDINTAWEAAMHARMARTSQSIATGQGTDNAEAEAQYRILTEFLNA